MLFGSRVIELINDFFRSHVSYVVLSWSFLQLLAADPALKRFKSHKKSVWRLKRVADVATIVVVAGTALYILEVKENGL